MKKVLAFILNICEGGGNSSCEARQLAINKTISCSRNSQQIKSKLYIG